MTITKARAAKRATRARAQRVDNVASRAAIDVWMLVFSDFLLLDATGPIQVFSTANDDARDAGLPPPYRIHLVAPRAARSRPVPASACWPRRCRAAVWPARR